ncbi:lysosomal acid glucosylceramidase-like isoform X4 [Passer montanus]|uniref:lysosomal acid glucosylceramidase-like isoform X4 n=1 Tax=Passer montanus TaxID=9160 RepID=UPI0019610418|nr:lysosomal acid glucosylceramidase-like isoform X4 [Passer montanus]
MSLSLLAVAVKGPGGSSRSAVPAPGQGVPAAGAAPRDLPEPGERGGAMGAVGILGWLLLLPVPQVAGARPCIPKDFGHGSLVCVCNATYCDTLDPVVVPAPGSYAKYESSKAGKRLERSEGKFQSSLSTRGLLLTLNISALHQHVKGFGGSLSDAAAMNILKLSQAAQDNLLRSYFSQSGIEYNLIRVPMACSDFSVRPYSYDDVPNDHELKHFRLADEDVKMKIPLLRRALAMSKRPLLLFASPWTAPAWMKSNGDVRGKGTLKGKAGDKYHKTWANYFIKFLDEYAKRNVTFWAVTAQNEPLAGLLTPPQAPTIAFTAAQQRDFIARDLGPALARSPHRTRLLMLDDQRIHLPHWAKVVLGNATAARYVAGLAVHWYLDAIVPPGCSLEATHKLFPDHFLLYTEACTGFFTFRFAVSLGCWERGDHYSYSILTVQPPDPLTPPTRAGAAPLSPCPAPPGHEPLCVWLDRLEPGPGPSGRPQLGQELCGQPRHRGRQQGCLLQAAHVLPPGALQVGQGGSGAATSPRPGAEPLSWCCPHSKFIPEGSRRVGLHSSGRCLLCQLEHVAVLRPDGALVLVVLNRFGRDVPFGIQDPAMGFIEAVAPAHSIQTYLWRQQ